MGKSVYIISYRRKTVHERSRAIYTNESQALGWLISNRDSNVKEFMSLHVVTPDNKIYEAIATTVNGRIGIYHKPEGVRINAHDIIRPLRPYGSMDDVNNIAAFILGRLNVVEGSEEHAAIKKAVIDFTQPKADDFGEVAATEIMRKDTEGREPTTGIECVGSPNEEGESGVIDFSNIGRPVEVYKIPYRGKRGRVISYNAAFKTYRIQIGEGPDKPAIDLRSDGFRFLDDGEVPMT